MSQGNDAIFDENCRPFPTSYSRTDTTAESSLLVSTQCFSCAAVGSFCGRTYRSTHATFCWQTSGWKCQAVAPHRRLMMLCKLWITKVTSSAQVHPKAVLGGKRQHEWLPRTNPKFVAQQEARHRNLFSSRPTEVSDFQLLPWANAICVTTNMCTNRSMSCTCSNENWCTHLFSETTIFNSPLPPKRQNWTGDVECATRVEAGNEKHNRCCQWCDVSVFPLWKEKRFLSSFPTSVRSNCKPKYLVQGFFSNSTCHCRHLASVSVRFLSLSFQCSDRNFDNRKKIQLVLPTIVWNLRSRLALHAFGRNRSFLGGGGKIKCYFTLVLTK